MSSQALPGEDAITAPGCWHLAEALAKSQDVILAVPEISGRSHRGFAMVYYNRHNIGRIAHDSDAVVCDATVIRKYTFIIAAGSPVAIDLAGASPDAGLEEPPGDGIKTVLEVGDFFFCKDEPSRELWLKALESCGRINPFTQKHDPALRRLIAVASLPAAGKSGGGTTTADSSLKPLDRFCASPRFAPDRGSDYNPAKLPGGEKPYGPAYYLRRLRHHLKTSGPRDPAARGSALKKRKISGEGKS